jgi:hypothetical protein
MPYGFDLRSFFGKWIGEKGPGLAGVDLLKMGK